MIQDAITGLFLPPTAGIPMVPWDDLHARNPDPTPSQISKDIVSTLATVVGKGPFSPRMIKATDAGELLTATRVSFSTRVTSHTLLGGSTVTVVDPTFAAGGFWFGVQQLGVHGGNTSEPYFAQPTTDPFTLKIDNTFAITMDVGDFLYALPLMMTTPGSVTDVTDRRTRILGQVGFIDPEWQVMASESGGVGSHSCSSGSIAGFRAVLHNATFSVSPNAGRVFNCRVWDGASGGTQIGELVLGNPGAAVGTTTVWGKLGYLKSSVGNALTMDFDFASVAGEKMGITASGLFQA